MNRFNRTIVVCLLPFISMGFTNSNAAGGMGTSDVRNALVQNQWDVIEKLIQEDPENQGFSRYERTILLRAGLSGKIDVVTYYLDRGTDIDRDLGKGFTLLHVAVRAGHTELARVLIGRGADLSAKTQEKMTPMMFAVLHEKPDIEKILAGKGVAKDVFTETIRGDIEAVKAYLADDPNLVSQYRGHFSLLHWAAYKGHGIVAEILIDQGGDVNGHKEYASPLFWAVRHNRVKTAKVLIDNGADVNLRSKNGQTVLFASARVKMTEFLLENGADPGIRDSLENTSLHLIGTKHMHKEAIRTIIDFDGYPGSPQPDTVTQEAIQEQLGVAKLLIDHGADPKSRNRDGKTALDFANESGFQPIIAFFEAAGGSQ